MFNYGHFECYAQHLLIFLCVIGFAPLRLDWDPRKARDATRALDFTGDNSVTWLQDVASLSSRHVRRMEVQCTLPKNHSLDLLQSPRPSSLSKQGPLFRVLGSATLKQERDVVSNDVQSILMSFYMCLHLFTSFTVLDTLHILHVLHMKQVLIRAPSKLDPARTYPTYKSEESLLRATFRRLDREAQNLLPEFTKCKSCSKMFKAHCNIPIHSLHQSLVRDWQGATTKELIGSEWSIHSQDSMTSIISYTLNMVPRAPRSLLA